MRQLHLHEIALPLLRPFTNAAGTVTERHTILVGITRDGQTGWGEASPYPGITDETVEGVWANLVREVAAVLDGGTPDLSESGAAAVDEAQTDLAAQEQGVPLWSMLGGAPAAVPAGLAVGIGQDPSEAVREIERAAALGIRSFKIKIEPGSDAAVIRHVRSSVGDLALSVDANGSYHVDDPFFDSIDELGLDYIEQPLAATQLHEHTVLRQRIETLVCLDESMAPAALARRAIDMGAADIACIKPARLGQRDSAVIAEHARSAGIALKASGMLESSIGKAHTLALAAGAGFAHVDLAPPSVMFAADPCGAAFALTDGDFQLPDRPGLGFAPDPLALAAVERRSLTLTR
jgi:O-succinylbenzoate synthase